MAGTMQQTTRPGAVEGRGRITRRGFGSIEFPTTFDLFVNLKVAKELGIEIPPIMILATDMIE
jgi:hypothetical protein